MGKITKKEKRAAEVVGILKTVYPDAVCALAYDGEPWRLLVLARLSAQCTDKRVNIVSVPLFERYPTLNDMADAVPEELYEIIKPCGLFRTKGRNIIDSCRMLLENFGGKVPKTMEELLSLPGVGRKIANLMLGDVYGLPAIVADTHCIRLSGRLGFCSADKKNPLRVERALAEVIAPEEQSDFCHRLVMFGRDRCTARQPHCQDCPLIGYCTFRGKTGTAE